MKDFIDDLERRRGKALQLGGEANVARQHDLGRLTARERIDHLLDPGTFMELGMLNHSDVPGLKEKTPGDGVISGLGRVDGRPVVIQASDKTVLAATEGTVHIRKGKTLRDYAAEN